MAIDLSSAYSVGGLSGSALTLFCLLAIIVSGFYMATAKTSTVMSKSRKAFYTFFAFFCVGLFMTGGSVAAFRYL